LFLSKTPHESSQAIEQAARFVREADALLVTAGAGMGVDSGLPDFRGNEGFWRAYPAIAKLGLSFAEMANPNWFDQSPELAWAFYGHRLNLYRRTKPHAVFQRLIDYGRQKRHGYFVFTSNVDGQFQKAGFAEDRVAECHGSIHHFQCCQPCHDAIWDADREKVMVDEANFLALAPLPKCPRCDRIARPNVLMFGDGRWLASRSCAQDLELRKWLGSLPANRAKLVIIELGAGTAISTVRRLSEHLAQEFAAPLIRINPREPDVPPAHVGLPLNAEPGLRQVFDLVEN
jgi:NAD-dependent SIR2 family protein deacetylase